MVFISWLDIGLIVFLSGSILFGVVRGLVFEVLSALGWIAAYFAAQWATPWLMTYVHVGEPGQAVNHGVTFACAFIGALILWGLAARVIRLLIRATPLSPIDRMLGAGFGFVRGVIVLLVLASLIGLTPLNESVAWRESAGVSWLNAALTEIKPLLPRSLSEHLQPRLPA